MEKYLWRYPNSLPSGFTRSDYRALLGRYDRDNPPCERLARGECSVPCQKPDKDGFRQLHLGHHQARALGGTVDLHNMQLECATVNMSNGAKEDERYAFSPFDKDFDYSKLRESQKSAIYAVDDCHDLFVNKNPNLSNRVLLCLLNTGAGKTMVMLAIAHRINLYVQKKKPGSKRCNKILFLHYQQALATAAHNEMNDDALKIGLIKEKFPSFDKTNENLDNPVQLPGIYHCCFQSFWLKKGSNKELADEATIKNRLSWYDTICIDEVDWANQRLVDLCRLAPADSFKFGLTASPWNKDNTISRHFAVGPISSYGKLRFIDLAAKHFDRPGRNGELSRSIVCDDAAFHWEDVLTKDFREGSANTHDALNAVLASIKKAIIWADRLESEMMESIPDEGYSPHVIIRANNARQADIIYRQVKQMVKVLGLKGKGWNKVSIHHSRVEKDKFPDGEKKPQNMRMLGETQHHPWFRAAKHLKGKADDECSRIMIVVDMGLRGLNNWTALAAVDGTPDVSMTFGTQYVGRLMRHPYHLRHWLDSNNFDDYARFCSPRIFLPFSESHGKALMYNQVIEDLYSGIEKIETARANGELLTWNDLLESDEMIDLPLTGELKKPGLTDNQRMQIEHGITEVCNENKIFAEDIPEKYAEVIVDTYLPNLDETYRKDAIDYAKSIFKDPGQVYKTRVTDPDKIVPVVTYQVAKKPNEYSLEEIAKYYMEKSPNIKFFEDAMEKIQKLCSDYPDMIQILRNGKHDEDMRLFAPPIDSEVPLQRNSETKKNGDVSYVQKLAGEIVFAELDPKNYTKCPEDWDNDRWKGYIYFIVNTCLHKLFAKDSVGNDSEVNTTEYKYVIESDRARYNIKRLIISQLAKNGYYQVPPSKNLPNKQGQIDYEYEH